MAARKKLDPGSMFSSATIPLGHGEMSRTAKIATSVVAVIILIYALTIISVRDLYDTGPGVGVNENQQVTQPLDVKVVD